MKINTDPNCRKGRLSVVLPVLVMVLLSAASLSALEISQPIQANPKGPRIRILTPEIQLGDLQPDKQVRSVIKIANDGDETLEILNVQASCGCVVPRDRVISIEPQASGNIAFDVLPTIDMYGPFGKFIFISSNDAEFPSITIPIRAKVVAQYELVSIPAAVDFGTVGLGETPIRRIVVVSPFARAPIIKGMFFSSQTTALTIQPLENPRSAYLEIELKLPANFPSGSFSENLTIETSENVINIPIHGTKKGLFEFDVPGLNFGVLGKLDTVELPLVVMSTQPDTVFSISQIEDSLGNLQIIEDLPAGLNGREHTYRVSLDFTREINIGPVIGKLIFLLDNGESMMIDYVAFIVE